MAPLICFDFIIDLFLSYIKLLCHISVVKSGPQMGAGMNAVGVIQTWMEASFAQLLAVKNFSQFSIHKKVI